jgi:hypothetical protein
MTEESKVQGATPHIFNDEPVRGGKRADEVGLAAM